MTTREFIAQLLENSALVNLIKNEKSTLPAHQAGCSGFLKFTASEVAQMPVAFRLQFNEEQRLAHIHKYEGEYRITYRKHGYNIDVTAFSIEKAKALFIVRTQCA